MVCPTKVNSIDGVMTDLNTLVPADSPLYLLWATSINSRSEIAGFGVTSSGDVHAFLATPSDGAQGDSFSPAQQGALKPVVLPENVRQQFFGRLGLRGR